jgi:hypothetical protein
MFAFQALGFGIQFSEVQQLVDEFQQVVGVLLYHVKYAFSVFGMVFEKFFKRINNQ